MAALAVIRDMFNGLKENLSRPNLGNYGSPNIKKWRAESLKIQVFCHSPFTVFPFDATPAHFPVVDDEQSSC